MTCACVRESVRARDIGMTRKHSCRNAYVLLNVLINVNYGIAYALRWGVALVEEFLYQTLLTPS